MKELKERFKEIKVPALTIKDYVGRMKVYDHRFSETFYTLLFILEDYIEQAAESAGFIFHPSGRHAQRLVLFLKPQLHYADFEQAITIEYINNIIAGEDTYPESFVQQLKEAKGFNRIMKHLYGTYLEDCIESAKEFSEEENNRILEEYVDRFLNPEKKEEEKKDMKETNFILRGSTFLHEVFEGLPPEIKQMYNIKTPKNGLPTVKQIYSNKKKGVTIVEFANGDKVRITREKADKDDIEKAIAIAMVKYAWGLKEYFNALENVVDSSKKSVIKKKPEKKETKEKTEKPLTKEQEQQKVIEITNQKEINIEYLKLYKDYKEYCEAQEKWLIREDLWLTEKEFDLLKRYFK